MSWSYSGDPTASPIDAVRFWCQDTDTDRQLLADEEIQYLINRATPIWDDPIATAALACDVICLKFAPEAISTSADGVTISGAELVTAYKTVGALLRQTYAEVAGAGAQPIAFGIAAFEAPDFSVSPPSFGVAMSDNFRAGWQNFGLSEHYYPEPTEVPESGYWTGN